MDTNWIGKLHHLQLIEIQYVNCIPCSGYKLDRQIASPAVDCVVWTYMYIYWICKLSHLEAVGTGVDATANCLKLTSSIYTIDICMYSQRSRTLTLVRNARTLYSYTPCVDTCVHMNESICISIVYINGAMAGDASAKWLCTIHE